MMDVRALGIKGDWYEISQARQQWTSVCEQICVSVGVGEVCAANRSSLIQVFLCRYGAFLPAVRPGCARPRAPVLSHNQCIVGGFMIDHDIAFSMEEASLINK